MKPEVTSALATIGGVVAGGGVTYLLTLLRDRRSAGELRRRFAAALAVELKENRSRFTDIAAYIKKLAPGGPLEELFNRWSGQQFFPVYDHGGHDLGLLRSEDLSDVAHAVGQFKNMMEFFNMVHEGAGRFSEAKRRHAIVGQTDVVAWLEEQDRQAMIHYADKLRTALPQLLADADTAIGVLQKYAN